MKYKRNNNKSTLEIMKEEKTNSNINDFDTNEYLDKEFVTETKKKETKKEEKETKKEPVKKAKKKTTKKKEVVKEEPVLTIEPIRTVTTEEYKDITRKRQEEKEKRLKKEQEKKNKKRLSIKRIINIIFIVVIILIVMVVVDIVSVSKYEKGPFFAIKTTTYKDGGTKVYHGIGYKVIKYHQVQGRRDMEIGNWSLKYDIEPITAEDIDLAIRFNNDEIKTYDDLYKKFVRINSILKRVNKENNTITIGYEDEEGKYTMDIVCKMADKKTDLDSLEVGKDTSIIGTVYDIKRKTIKSPTVLKIKNCFVEQ